MKILNWKLISKVKILSSKIYFHNWKFKCHNWDRTIANSQLRKRSSQFFNSFHYNHPPSSPSPNVFNRRGGHHTGILYFAQLLSGKAFFVEIKKWRPSWICPRPRRLARKPVNSYIWIMWCKNEQKEELTYTSSSRNISSIKYVQET